MNSQAATEFEPSTEWVNEEDCDTLLIYLPGFVKEQLRVQLRSRTLIISGLRKVNDETSTRFRQEFLVSEHCDVSKISAKFEGSILYVKQPKSTTRVTKQEEKLPMNSPSPPTPNLPHTSNPISEKPMEEPKAHVEEEANVKPDSNSTSLAQLDGDSGVGEITKEDGPEEEKDTELKVPKEGVCENASKKKTLSGGLEMVMKLKPWMSDASKVLVLVTGFVVGVCCAKLVQSWIA